MTMPCERTRALRFAGEVLQELLTREDVPADLKHQARVTLRHYPSAAEIKSQARLPAFHQWIEPEDKYERRGQDLDGPPTTSLHLSDNPDLPGND